MSQGNSCMPETGGDGYGGSAIRRRQGGGGMDRTDDVGPRYKTWRIFLLRRRWSVSDWCRSPSCECRYHVPLDVLRSFGSDDGAGALPHLARRTCACDDIAVVRGAGVFGIGVTVANGFHAGVARAEARTLPMQAGTTLRRSWSRLPFRKRKCSFVDVAKGYGSESRG